MSWYRKEKMTWGSFAALLWCYYTAPELIRLAFHSHRWEKAWLEYADLCTLMLISALWVIYEAVMSLKMRLIALFLSIIAYMCLMIVGSYNIVEFRSEESPSNISRRVNE